MLFAESSLIGPTDAPLEQPYKGGVVFDLMSTVAAFVKHSLAGPLIPVEPSTPENKPKDPTVE